MSSENEFHCLARARSCIISELPSTAFVRFLRSDGETGELGPLNREAEEVGCGGWGPQR